MAHFDTKTKRLELTDEDTETLQRALPKDWHKNLMSVVMCDDIKVDWKKNDEWFKDEAYKQNSD